MDCKDFSKEDTEDVCQAREALAYAIAAYLYFSSDNCCGESGMDCDFFCDINDFAWLVTKVWQSIFLPK